MSRRATGSILRTFWQCGEEEEKDGEGGGENATAVGRLVS